MDVNRVKSGLNSINPVRVELAASKIYLLSKAQSIIYSAEEWLCHNDIINLLKATVQCTSAKSKRIQRASVDNYRPLLSPLPACKPTTYIKILDPTNKIVVRYHSDDDTFNNSVYDLKEFNWLNFKDSEGEPYHMEFLQGYTWTRCSWPHCVENHEAISQESPSIPIATKRGYRIGRSLGCKDMHDMNDSWLISKNSILMSKAPPFLDYIMCDGKEKYIGKHNWHHRWHY